MPAVDGAADACRAMLADRGIEYRFCNVGSGGVLIGAHPQRLVMAPPGDGAYLFSNPLAEHHATRKHGLPILVVIFGKVIRNAVRPATRGICPGGGAARSEAPAFTRPDDLPAFEDVCVAAGGDGERVGAPRALPAALKRAIDAVMHGKRQALLDVMCCAG